MIGFATPAYAADLSSINIKEGLSIETYTSVSPRLQKTYNKFHYTKGDPAIFGRSGTLADVLAYQDRQESDQRLRAAGADSASLEIIVKQQLTKKTALGTDVYLYYNPDESYNYGANWGVWLDFGSFGELGRITVGDGWTRLPVSQTNADNVIQHQGKNLSAQYTGIPNLTLAGYYIPNGVELNSSNRPFGMESGVGLAGKYQFDLQASQNLTLAAGATYNKGNPNKVYWDDAGDSRAYMVSASYQHKNLTVAADYGKSEARYDTGWYDTLDTTVYGVKADYDITPRLTASLSYAHKTNSNSKPVDINYLVSIEDSVNEARAFSKVTEDRYQAELRYHVYKDISLKGSVESQQTKNYLDDGEFSRRDRLTTSVGATFIF